MCEIVLRPRAYVVPFISVVAFELERDIYNFFVRNAIPGARIP